MINEEFIARRLLHVVMDDIAAEEKVSRGENFKIVVFCRGYTIAIVLLTIGTDLFT